MEISEYDRSVYGSKFFDPTDYNLDYDDTIVLDVGIVERQLHQLPQSRLDDVPISPKTSCAEVATGDGTGVTGRGSGPAMVACERLCSIL